MAKRRDSEIDELLNEAQSRTRCLTTKDRTLREALDRRVGISLIKPRTHLYARESYWASLTRRNQEEHIIRGMASLHPNWVFCNASAALIHRLPISYRHLEKSHILAEASTFNTRSTSKIKRHARSVHIPDITNINGLKVTSLEDTIVDCLLELDFREGLAIADATTARLNIDSEELSELVSKIGHSRPGVRRALKTVLWANALSESGGESMARAIMIEHGFMLPELQVNIKNSNKSEGNWRVDFFWKLPDGTTVAGEFDGTEKYTNPEMTHGNNAIQVMSAERIRESRITLAVDRVMRFSYADVINEYRLVTLLDRFGIPRIR